jgi:diguanylate cyclase (GGDEF)-like protein/PAS domain S-box-containing protein
MYRTLTCLTQEHRLELVLLAAVVCCLASFTGISLLGRARASTARRLGWLAAAAVTTGSGIWATHFVAMLAYRPGLPVAYELGFTLASVVVAVAVAALGLAVVTYGRGTWQAPAGGAIVGLGIGGMHFIGMAAMRAQAEIGWDVPLVAAALLLAASLGAASMTAFARQWTRQSTLLASGLLTTAIIALHFTAMGALELTPTPLRPMPDALSSHGWLASGIAAATIWILAMGLVGALVDLYLAKRAADEAARLRSLVNATFEGICIHCEGHVLDANDALGRLIGRSREALAGRPVLELVAPDHRPLVQARIAAGSEEPYEAELLHSDGRRIQVELLGRAVTYEGRAARVVSVRDMTERHRAEQRIRHLAHHDGLTDLPNRMLFRDRLDQALASARRSGQALAVLCLDLDRFKEVNDLYGHAAGDELLVQVGMRLCAETRESDTVARLGGDEFAVIQCGMGRPDAVADLAQRLIDTICDPFCLLGQQTLIGASVGIALFPHDGDDVDTLLRNADLALYRAKGDGRGTFRSFEPEMDARLQARRQLERELRETLAAGGLTLHFQPLADAGGGEITGFEALVRWPHPTRGMVGPAEFIPLAEECGLILALGEWVLHAACREAVGWPSPMRIAVNLSPAQFGHGDLPGLVRRVLAETGLAPERLELEITEGVLMKDNERTLAILRQLKGLGVRIAMDDFGTGYSSLSYLQQFPFDKLKIDQSFVRLAEHSTDSLAIVRAVIGLGKSLGMPVVAEGVETAGQRDLLARERCDEVQGYLIGRPMPADRIRAFLAGPTPVGGPCAMPVSP